MLDEVGKLIHKLKHKLKPIPQVHKSIQHSEPLPAWSLSQDFMHWFLVIAEKRHPTGQPLEENLIDELFYVTFYIIKPDVRHRFFSVHVLAYVHADRNDYRKISPVPCQSETSTCWHNWTTWHHFCVPNGVYMLMILNTIRKLAIWKTRLFWQAEREHAAGCSKACISEQRRKT